MSSPEPRLKPDDEMQFGHPEGVVRPTGPESKQAANVKTPIAGGIPLSRGEANAGDDG